MDENNFSNDKGGTRNRFLLLIAIVVILACVGVVLAVNLVNQAAGELFSPVSAISTQVANFFNPEPTVRFDPEAVIHQIQALARLETIQYTIEKVITAESGHPDALEFLFGDKLILVAHGEIIAGVDMAKIEAEDLVMKDETLYVMLPRVEIFVAELDNEKTYVFDRDTGLFTHGNVDLETIARQAAEEAVLNAALDDGILVQAEINAEHYLIRLFDALGFPDVVFEFAEE
jgi:hypothetical protein